jgi:hypothetical protein
MMIKKLIIPAVLLILLCILLAVGFIFFKNSNDTTNLKEISNIYTKQEANMTISPANKQGNTNNLSNEKYPLHKKIYATMFWVGEDSSDENDYIPNKSSAWDIDWIGNYGGVDNPYERRGYHPVSFTPKENPFYYALPYTEYDDSGLKANAYKIPWSNEFVPGNSILKNRWAKVIHKNQICYGQWEDVGPFEEDDVDYVFGTNKPKNKRAGIDLSPALRTCLRMATNDYVDWQFVDEENVPDGPWKETITTSQINW